MRTLWTLLAIGLLALAGCPTTGDDDASDDDVGDDDAADCVYQAPTEWVAAGALPSARESLAAVSSGGNVILLGGWTGSATSDQVSVAAVSDGQLGTWTDGPALPVGLEHHAAVVVDGVLYVIGGDDGAAGRTEVYRAELGGSLGAWSETAPLPQPRVFHAAVAHGDWIYVVGGLQGFTTAQPTVYRGEVGGDGEIGSWEEARALPDARYAAAALVQDDVLYVLGGAWNGSTATQSGWSAAIEPDGSLGEWYAAMAIPAATLSHGAVLAGDRVVLTGGFDWTTASADAHAALASTGPTTWAPLPSLPDARFAHGAVLVDGHALLLGGWETLGNAMHDAAVSARVCE